VTLFPRTLFGRNALLILGLIGVAQLLGVFVFRELVQRPRTDQLADIASDYVSGVVDGLQALPPQQRHAFLQAFTKGERVWIVPVGLSTPDQTRITNLLWQRYAQTIAARLHKSPKEVVWSSDYQGSLWIRVSVAEDPYWVILRGLSAGSTLSSLALVVSGLIVMLAVVGAFLIQRRINRPLRRLVDCARQLARGQQPQPLPEEPPEEVATVTHAFNQMMIGLAQIDHERTVMLAGVSHDLRTPLSKVRLAIEIMEARIDPDLLISLRTSLQEIELIIDQFMEYGRASLGETFEWLDVSELIEESMASRGLQPGALELSLSSMSPVWVQRRSLIRAISNLLDNAMRYGAAPISIRNQMGHKTISISVLDRGQGIPDTEIGAMKQPFRRGSSARSGTSGSGLGLAIVERVARAHGGELKLINRSGGGLEASIELPITTAFRPSSAAHPT
jgi:two-component system osmolarity sensor histidine kinase EnvZ